MDSAQKKACLRTTSLTTLLIQLLSSFTQSRYVLHKVCVRTNCVRSSYLLMIHIAGCSWSYALRVLAPRQYDFPGHPLRQARAEAVCLVCLRTLSIQNIFQNMFKGDEGRDSRGRLYSRPRSKRPKRRSPSERVGAACPVFRG